MVTHWRNAALATLLTVAVAMASSPRSWAAMRDGTDTLAHSIRWIWR
jgi:hypothetical protein